MVSRYARPRSSLALRQRDRKQPVLRHDAFTGVINSDQLKSSMHQQEPFLLDHHQRRRNLSCACWTLSSSLRSHDFRRTRVSYLIPKHPHSISAAPTAIEPVSSFPYIPTSSLPLALHPSFSAAFPYPPSLTAQKSKPPQGPRIVSHASLLSSECLPWPALTDARPYCRHPQLAASGRQP